MVRGLSFTSLLALESPIIPAATFTPSESTGVRRLGSCASLAMKWTMPRLSRSVAIFFGRSPQKPVSELAVICTKHPWPAISSTISG